MDVSFSLKLAPNEAQKDRGDADFSSGPDYSRVPNCKGGVFSDFPIVCLQHHFIMTPVFYENWYTCHLPLLIVYSHNLQNSYSRVPNKHTPAY